MTSDATTTQATEYPLHVLREYAFLADGERGILVGPRGDYAWMCAPRWDSDALFSSLIGGGGAYAVTPTDPRFVWGGYYEEGSLIWRSHWITAAGVIECREALAFPGDAHTAVVLRRIVATRGPARVKVILDARAGFGAHKMGHLHVDGGVWTARSGGLHLRWSGGAGARPAPGGGLEMQVDLDAGSHHDLVLELSDRSLPTDPVQAAAAWEATEAAWGRAMPDLGGSLAPRDVRHSYAVLRGLTSTGGGMVAAATMSLPERSEAGRNYDYRYVWIRDQCYTGQAIAAHGPHPLLDSAVAFVSERLADDGPQLKPAYTVTGGAVPDERRLPGLAGYPGGSDKAGNWVNKQFQLDALGEALLLFATAAGHDRLGVDQWRAAETAVKAIELRWSDADAGVWELDDRHWAHSRLMCVAGLRAIASAGAAGSQAGAWTSLADTIMADVASDSLHPSGRWQRAPDDERVDAALLLPPIRGALPAADPRSLATLDAVQRELGRSGYVYRFRHDDRPLEDAEGAFGLCGFLMALAIHQQGRAAEAVGWFERNRDACGPPGLFTEEFDVRQRQQRGNLPQAFVHALMFESAVRLAGPDAAADCPSPHQPTLCEIGADTTRRRT
ncbi:MAG: glycoside hydrolase family 15 protein [Actinomycetota bacterium]|nr:glycoside hydrolase family 15 protein [Actinomycetota bacterium]